MGIDRASEYYTQDLGKEDYYLKGSEPPGEWIGEESERLGLKGIVERETLRSAMSGVVPNGSGKVIHKGGHSATRAPGWDMTFSANKYVSVLYARHANDEVGDAIRRCHQEAVKGAMKFAENFTYDAVRRVSYERVNGERKKITKREKPKGLIYSSFEHKTARQANEKSSPDPQLHSHVLVLNQAERQDGSWGALELKTLYRHHKAVGAAYRSELAHLLKRELGVEIERDGEDFKLKNVPDDLKQQFSKRREQIRSFQRKEGSTGDYERAQYAALKTRHKKQDFSHEELLKNWQSHMDESGFDIIRSREGLGVSHDYQEAAASEVIHEVLEKLTASKGVFTDQDLYQALAIEAQTRSSLRTLEEGLKQVKSTPEVVSLGADYRGIETFTTRSYQELEDRCLLRASDLSKARGHELDLEQAKVTLSDFQDDFFKRKGFNLNEGQVKAISHIVSTGDFTLVEGWAGTGKSTIMEAVQLIYEKQGYKVKGVTPTHAARMALEGAGIQTMTVARLILDNEKFKSGLDDKTILIMDESGMVSTKDFDRILGIAEKSGAKVISVGDSEQISSVEAGGILKPLMEDIGGAKLTDVVRQKNPLQREAAIQIRSGNLEKAFSLLEEAGSLSFQSNKEKSIDELVEAFISSYLDDKVSQEPKSRTVIARVNSDVATINEKIRDKIIENGFMNPERGFTVEVQNSAGKFSKSFAVGDSIVITGNDNRLGFTNGMRGEIVDVDQRLRFQIKTEQGLKWLDTTKFKKFDYGYAGTAYKSQGGTYDQAFVLVDRGLRKEDSYVTMSRQVGDIKLFIPKSEVDINWSTYQRKLSEKEHKEIKIRANTDKYAALLGLEGKQKTIRGFIQDQERGRGMSVEPDLINPILRDIGKTLDERNVNKQLIHDLRVVFLTPNGVRRSGESPSEENSLAQQIAFRMIKEKDFSLNARVALKEAIMNGELGVDPVRDASIEKAMNERSEQLKKAYREALKAVPDRGLKQERPKFLR